MRSKEKTMRFISNWLIAIFLLSGIMGWLWLGCDSKDKKNPASLDGGSVAQNTAERLGVDGDGPTGIAQIQIPDLVDRSGKIVAESVVACSMIAYFYPPRDDTTLERRAVLTIDLEAENGYAKVWLRPGDYHVVLVYLDTLYKCDPDIPKVAQINEADITIIEGQITKVVFGDNRYPMPPGVTVDPVVRNEESQFSYDVSWDPEPYPPNPNPFFLLGEYDLKENIQEDPCTGKIVESKSPNTDFRYSKEPNDPNKYHYFARVHTVYGSSPWGLAATSLPDSSWGNLLISESRKLTVEEIDDTDAHLLEAYIYDLDDPDVLIRNEELVRKPNSIQDTVLIQNLPAGKNYQVELVYKVCDRVFQIWEDKSVTVFPDITVEASFDSKFPYLFTASTEKRYVDVNETFEIVWVDQGRYTSGYEVGKDQDSIAVKDRLAECLTTMDSITPRPRSPYQTSISEEGLFFFYVRAITKFGRAIWVEPVPVEAGLGDLFIERNRIIEIDSENIEMAPLKAFVYRIETDDKVTAEREPEPLVIKDASQDTVRIENLPAKPNYFVVVAYYIDDFVAHIDINSFVNVIANETEDVLTGVEFTLKSDASPPEQGVDIGDEYVIEWNDISWEPNPDPLQDPTEYELLEIRLDSRANNTAEVINLLKNSQSLPDTSIYFVNGKNRTFVKEIEGWYYYFVRADTEFGNTIWGDGALVKVGDDIIGPGGFAEIDESTKVPDESSEGQIPPHIESIPGGINVELPGGVEMELVEIRPGTFIMGTAWGPEHVWGLDPDEHPPHIVTISKEFFMGKNEVTQAQWEALMGPGPWEGESQVQSGPEYPAVYVSWDTTQAFIDSLNKWVERSTNPIFRLPTEAEWEFACRAGTDTTAYWSFGSDRSRIGDYAWYETNTINENMAYAQQVGGKIPSPWGLYDMYGNVYEWVQNYFEDYTYGFQINPTGPETGDNRVARGGSFLSQARYTRSANRYNQPPETQKSDIGFRIVYINP